MSSRSPRRGAPTFNLAINALAAIAVVVIVGFAVLVHSADVATRASAQGYNGGGNAPPPPSAPPGAFTTPIASVTYNAATGATLSGQSGGTSATLIVPPHALPDGTVITLYAGNASVLAGYLPSGQSYITSIGVSWIAPDGTSPDATVPLTLTIADPAIHAGDHVYITTPTGVAPTAATVTSGAVTVTFTRDPGYVVSGPTPGIPIAGALVSGGVPLLALTVLALLLATATALMARRALRSPTL